MADFAEVFRALRGTWQIYSRKDFQGVALLAALAERLACSTRHAATLAEHDLKWGAFRFLEDGVGYSRHLFAS